MKEYLYLRPLCWMVSVGIEVMFLKESCVSWDTLSRVKRVGLGALGTDLDIFRPHHGQLVPAPILVRSRAYHREYPTKKILAIS
jgi:hypothetical protein